MNLFEKITPIEYEEQVTKEDKIPEQTKPRQRTEITELKNMKSISFGKGSKSIHMSEQGLWIGADKFEDAPFKVSIEGVMTSA